MNGEIPKYPTIQSLQCSRPFWGLEHLDVLKFLCNRNRKRKSLHQVEAPKEIDATENKRARLLRSRNLATHMEEPVVVASKVGWCLSGHADPFKRP
jgi:hypothetical protein